MINVIEQIHQSLEKQAALHRQLLDAVRVERNALISADLHAIQECTSLKEGLIEGIRLLETDRLKHVAMLALKLRRPTSELTLSAIISHTESLDLALAGRLASANAGLAMLLHGILEENARNRSLVDSSLEHIQNMKKNVLGEAAPTAQTYSPAGQHTHHPGGSRLISREA